MSGAVPAHVNAAMRRLGGEISTVVLPPVIDETEAVAVALVLAIVTLPHT
jgi:hypothetical protein